MLHHNGAQLTPSAEDAEIIVINTRRLRRLRQTGVRQHHPTKMVQHLRWQNGGKAQRIVVAGCLVERYRDEIQKNIPEVDAVVGTGELESLLAAAGLTVPAKPAAPLRYPSRNPPPIGCPIFHHRGLIAV